MKGKKRYLLLICLPVCIVLIVMVLIYSGRGDTTSFYVPFVDGNNGDALPSPTVMTPEAELIYKDLPNKGFVVRTNGTLYLRRYGGHYNSEWADDYVVFLRGTAYHCHITSPSHTIMIAHVGWETPSSGWFDRATNWLSGSTRIWHEALFLLPPACADKASKDSALSQSPGDVRGCTNTKNYELMEITYHLPSGANEDIRKTRRLGSISFSPDERDLLFSMSGPTVLVNGIKTDPQGAKKYRLRLPVWHQ